MILRQHLRGVHHALVRCPPQRIHPEAIVNLLVAIQRQPNQKMVFPEKTYPAFIQCISVGLNRVMNRHAFFVVPLFQLNERLKEIQSCQRRLAALKDKRAVPAGGVRGYRGS